MSGTMHDKNISPRARSPPSFAREFRFFPNIRSTEKLQLPKHPPTDARHNAPENTQFPDDTSDLPAEASFVTRIPGYFIRSLVLTRVTDSVPEFPGRAEIREVLSKFAHRAEFRKLLSSLRAAGESENCLFRSSSSFAV